MKRGVIYTAICQNYDELREPEFVSPHCDYVCFSDSPALRSKHWQIRPFDELFPDPTRTSRKPKILPHRYFPDHEWSVYVDANVTQRGDLAELARTHLQHHSLALFRHPERRKSLFDEADACIAGGKDDPERIRHQMEHYRSLGYPGDEAIPACMWIARRHHEPDLREAMEDWWAEIQRHSRRDQLSFHFIAWKRGLEFAVIDDDLRDNANLLWRPHDSIALREGLEERTRRADAVILSVPKSGRTWLRYFLGRYLERAFGVPFSLDFPSAEGRPELLFSHNHLDLFQDWPASPEILFEELLRNKALMLLVRDPRDVAVSYFHQKHTRERVFDGTLDEFVRHPIYGIERQSRFVHQLLDLARSEAKSTLVVRYEDLLQRGERRFAEILRFLYGAKPQANALRGAIADSAFDAMRATEISISRSGELERVFHRLGTADWDGDPNALKVRRGQAGAFRGELDRATLSELKRLPETRRLLRRLRGRRLAEALRR